MVKENPDTKPKAETPFRKFERLAKKIVRVPKGETEKTVPPGPSKPPHGT
jgi:hypothetical protein